MAQSPPFRIDSKPKRYTSIIGIVFGIGIVSIYFYIDILMKLHNFYTLLFVIPLYGYVFGDVIMWLWSGVRAVEVDVSGLKIIYPDGHPAKHIKLSEIGNIRIASSVDGKTVNILFHGAISKKVLWMDFFSGPRVRIPEAPFDKKEFAELVHRIAAITPIPQ